MSLFYKKVDAIFFKLTDEEKADVNNRKAVFFEGSQVKAMGGEQYLALLQQGENLIRIFEGQYLIRHPDGLWQILWPDAFNRHFIPGKLEDQVTIANDPFKAKAFGQPTVL